MNTVPLSTPDDISALQRFCRKNFLLLFAASLILICSFATALMIGTETPTPDNNMLSRSGVCGWLAAMVIVPLVQANGSRSRFKRATAATALVGTAAIILIILRWGI
jgi:hypothetical protein